MAMNVHRVLFGPAMAEHYLQALTLEDDRVDKLREARDVCRNAIRAGLRAWQITIRKARLFEVTQESLVPNSLKPKFRMQGSFAYRTLNEPAQAPPQEIDLDDGIFVPVSFLLQDGTAHPILISSGYFAAVEELLAPVCDERGWTIERDKPSCVRVRLDSNAHVDFALYAIPDEEFDRLVENQVLAKAMNGVERSHFIESLDFALESYQALREDQIMLAHRKDGWKPSDPRQLEEWFRAALARHDEQLRRVCRYLKGWRDHQWAESRLSSIALMVCTVAVYDEQVGMFDQSRDDLALRAVAEQLPVLLSNEIGNPVVEGQRLDEGWSPESRAEFVAKANDLYYWLCEATDGTDSPHAALTALTTAFGTRIPDNVSLVKAEGGAPLAAPVVLTAGLIKDIGDGSGPREAVRREGDRRYG